MEVAGLDPARCGHPEAEVGKADLEIGREIDRNEEARHGLLHLRCGRALGSAPAELLHSCWRRHSNRLRFVPKRNPALGEVIWRHLDRNAVSREHLIWAFFIRPEV